MSKTSYFLIAVMLAALIYMGAVRGYQMYERKAAEKAALDSVSGNAFTFQNVPVSLAAPIAEPMAKPVVFDASNTAIFLETAPLSDQQKKQQAQDTIESILEDYQEDPLIQNFNRDLSAATGGNVKDLGALGGVELVKILKENPQVSQVVQQNMQNPEFAKTVEQIFTNPQFIESIKQLQQTDGLQYPSEQREKAESNRKILYSIKY